MPCLSDQDDPEPSSVDASRPPAMSNKNGVSGRLKLWLQSIENSQYQRGGDNINSVLQVGGDNINSVLLVGRLDFIWPVTGTKLGPWP